MNVLLRFYRFISGEQTTPPSPQPNRNGSDPTHQSPDHELFMRLFEESNSPSYVRRVKTEILQTGKLVDEVIMLIFNLQKPTGGFVQNSLIEALDRRKLLTFRSVVYIYVDENVELLPSAYQLQVSFYDRIMELSAQSANLQSFIDERYQLHLESNQSDTFDPNNADRAREFRGLLVNLLECQFSVCRKDFPAGSTDYVFLVGRMPLYDSQQMTRYYRDRTRQVTPVNVQEPQDIYLAATVKADGHHEGKPLRFNAHRFGSKSDNSPQREFSLYIGNWRTDWEFSIGSAEHDEIQHSAMLNRAERLKLNSLQISKRNNRWEYVISNPKLPDWIKFFDHDATRKPRQEGIRLCCVKPPTLNNPLLNVISRQQFRQEISLIGRMLPSSGGQLQRFQDAIDSRLRAAVGDLNVVSAIEVRDSLWLIVTDDQRVMRVSQNDQRRWESVPLAHAARFAIGDTEYRWHAGRSNLYPNGFAGALSIYPATAEAQSFKKQLNVDKDAEGFLVSFDGPFDRKINPDDLLGRNGVVTIKCVDVHEDEGRGKYAFLPVQDPAPRNPFFAFQPVYAREKGWPAGKSWLTYDGDAPSDLTLDSNSGEVLFDGKRILAEDHTYHLISGSSLFQLKVSGTPYIGTATSAGVSTPASAPTAAPDVPPAEAAAASPSSEFKPIQIKIGLSKTRWTGYDVEDADRSNFAAHFRLTAPEHAKPTYFLKAFFPHSVESSNRELKFYEQYRSRANELFLCSPEVLRPTDDPSESPWAFVFPLLDTYEKYLSSAAQVTIWQAAAVGVGMATLFQAMAKDGLINFDIDITQFCFDSNGRLVIVDFDNVFKILTDPEDESQLEPLLAILQKGRLPAKNSVLPPEAHAFMKTANPDDRPNQLAQIGAAFSTYMLAAVLLQLLKAEIPFEEGTLVRQGAAEKLNNEDVKQFEYLLSEMLSASPEERPDPAEVLTRLEEIVTTLCKQNAQARIDCMKLLGRRL